MEGAEPEAVIEGDVTEEFAVGEPTANADASAINRRQKVSTSTTASAKACGASWGRLCPIPPAALSPVATTAQDGSLRQAGGPDTSLNAAAAIGRWVSLGPAGARPVTNV